MLKIYGQSDIYPFHMPGHKRRLGPSETEHLYEMDITEIDGFDNLHEPEGILKDAQTFAADLYHSEETVFIINGSTAGLLASIAGYTHFNPAIETVRIEATKGMPHMEKPGETADLCKLYLEH